MKNLVKIFILVVFCIVLIGDGKFLTQAKTNDLAKAVNENKANISTRKKSASEKSNENKSAGLTMPSVPISFEENKGQSDSSVKFISRGRGYGLFLKSNEVIYQLPDKDCETRFEKNRLPIAKSRIKTTKSCQTTSLQMKFSDANPGAFVEGVDALETKTNYFIGDDSQKWQTGVQSFQTVRYTKIYEGIGAIFRGNDEKNLEYDFHVSPNADVNQIQLEFSGAKKLKINRNGELVLKYKGGEIRHKQPFAYQIIDGEKRAVTARFILLSKSRAAFAIGEYDKTKELVIDPIVYATYLGGSLTDSSQDVALDSAGNIYVTSQVRSGNFLHTETPGSNRLYGGDVAVTKFNPSGSTVLNNTYVGGDTGYEVAYAMDVDASGNVYIAGQTSSTDFPMVNARQTAHGINSGDGYEGFVTKINASGMIVYSTYHGNPANGNDWVDSIAADSSGNAYVSGATSGTGFPVMNAYQSIVLGPYDGYLSKLSPSGQLLYSTLFGGVGGNYPNTNASDVTVDDQGNAFVTGETSSTQLPVTSGAYQTSGDGYVAKFDTTKTGSQSLVYSTYIPGSGSAIDKDPEGNVYVASLFGLSITDHKIIKLNTGGTSALYSFPITDSDFRLNDIAVDQNGNAYFVQEFYRSNYIKVTGLKNNGSLIDSVIISDADKARGIAVANGYAYVVGSTYTRTFPSTSDAYQRQNRGSTDPYSTHRQGFLAKVKVERNPLIFVPGTMGSEIVGPYLSGTAKYWTNLTPTYDPTIPSVLNLTLNNSSPYYKEGLYASDVLRSVAGKEIYQPLLTALSNAGYDKPYDITKGYPDKGECDITQKSSNPSLNKNLFIFPYDFRKDNNLSAQKLAQYVQCVQSFYPPGTKIDILAHSQGGLVTRRYILQKQAQNQPHGLGKVITVASPWLGAPEAIYKIYTGGDWDVFKSGFSAVISPPTIRWLSPYFPSIHQLFPSRIYHQWRGGVIFENGDVNGNGIPDENYSFDQILRQFNTDFPATYPGTIGAGFHDAAGQDDWRQDQSGIQYYHIVAEQNVFNTTVGLIVKNNSRCRFSILGNGNEGGRCYYNREYIPNKGFGDGTVPTISASRYQADKGYLGTPNSEWLIARSLSELDDEDAEHNGVTKTKATHDLVAYLLGVGSKPVIANQSSLTESSAHKENVSSDSKLSESGIAFEKYSGTNFPVARPINYYSPARYLRINGRSDVVVSDENGNTAAIENGLLRDGVPGLKSYEVIGENSIMLTLSVNHSYSVSFIAGDEPIEIEMVEGRGNQEPNLALRYKDLDFPANVTVKMGIPQSSAADLRYDADGNGTFETLVAPTVSLSGTAATDITPPKVNINVTRQGNSATATITAQDTASGVKNIRYSLDGTNFSVYTAPLTINYSSNTVTVYAFADDHAGNRSGLAVKTVYSNVSVGGTITYGTTPAEQTAKSVSGVALTAVAADTSPVSGVTDTAGAYLLGNLTPNSNYTVTASKTGNINGITPFDATLVLRCVAAGSGCALTPNQKLAANTNGDPWISPFDATLILRFVAANAQTENTGQVGNWKFDPATRNYPSFSGMLSGENYSGYLMGDVNGSWTAAQFAAAPSNAQIQISVPQNTAAAQGSTVLVPVAFSNNNTAVPVRAYSFHVEFDPAILQPDASGIGVTGTLSERCSFTTDTATAGRIGIASSCAITAASGTLLNLRFTVAGQANTATGATPLAFKIATGDNPTPTFEDGQSNRLSVEVTGGQFTVTAPTTATAVENDSLSDEKSEDSSAAEEQEQQFVTSGVQIALPQNASVTPGSVVSIPVTLTNNTRAQVSAFSFDVQFNPALLQAAGAAVDTTETLSSNCFVEANTVAPGRVVIAGACGSNGIAAAAGTQLNLRFTVTGQASNASAEARALRFWQTPVFEDNKGHRIQVGRTNGSVR